MNNKILIKLFAVALILIAILFALNWSTEDSPPSKNNKLFADVNGQVVSKIKIEQENEILELELKDGYWALPAKNYYRAESGKVRSLLLGIFDMSVNQTIPATIEQYEKLGLSDAAIKKGNAKVSLLSVEGNLLASLRLGQGRKGKNADAPLVISGGQFIKREDRPEVYLLDKPIVISKGATSWLDVNLLNVLPANLFSIMQVQNADNSTAILFDLQRTELTNKSGQVAFDLKEKIPEGKTLQQSAVLDLSSALEDLTIADVYKTDEQELKDLYFDNQSIFKTTKGLVYQVLSAKKGEKNFVKISVKLDDDLIAQVKERSSASSTASTSSTTTVGDMTSSTSVSTTTIVPQPEQKYASKEEAEKLNAELKTWIYEIPAYKAKRFRFTKVDLLEAPKPPAVAPVPQQ